MKVLSVASEAFPLVKTGGLADVVGALPRAMAQEGVEIRTLLPGYPAVLASLEQAAEVHRDAAFFGGPARMLAARAKGLEVFVIDAPHLYDRPGNPYVGPDGTDWPDNDLRFAALGSIGAAMARGLVPRFLPDIVHVHDWQAGLAPAYMRLGAPAAAKSIVTVHNMAFQGVFGAESFAALGLPPHAFAVDGIEFYGRISYLKAALQFADAITTVSPTYAREICTPEFGMGLEGVLQAHKDRLHGIVNGIDTEVWSPATDPALACRYDVDSLTAREANKTAVEARFALASGAQPLYCVVSRLTWQKGMDVLVAILDHLAATGARLAVLGSGEAALEHAFRAAAERHATRIGAFIGYDENLSHLMLGGADAILVPSRFEPCGLTQLQGLRYGCVPVVSRIGGLVDTVIDADDPAAAGTGTGIQLASIDAAGLAHAIHRTNAVFAEADAWRALQTNGMRCDVSWHHSAQEYARLYRSLL